MIRINNISLMKVLLFLIIISFISSNIEASEYHVGSYNIWVSGSKKSSWENRVDSICNLILFNNFDILGTQEVSLNQLNDMNKRLKEVYLCYGVGRDDGKEKGEQCTIFYKKDKFKLIEGNTIWLSETPEKVSKGWDASYNRILSYAKFKDIRDNTEIWFFNTHLDNIGKKAKIESYKLILDKIEKICPANANIVLTGDFNFNQRSALYKSIANSKLLKDSYKSAKYKWAPTGSLNLLTPPGDFYGFTPEKISWNTYDHIFVSKFAIVSRYGVLNNFFYSDNGKAVTTIDGIDHNNIKTKVIKYHIPSDHYPVSVWLNFNK